jgi:hypothetical protein
MAVFAGLFVFAVYFCDQKPEKNFSENNTYFGFYPNRAGGRAHVAPSFALSLCAPVDNVMAHYGYVEHLHPTEMFPLSWVGLVESAKSLVRIKKLARFMSLLSRMPQEIIRSHTVGIFLAHPKRTIGAHDLARPHTTVYAHTHVMSSSHK